MHCTLNTTIIYGIVVRGDGADGRVGRSLVGAGSDEGGFDTVVMLILV